MGLQKVVRAAGFSLAFAAVSIVGLKGRTLASYLYHATQAEIAPIDRGTLGQIEEVRVRVALTSDDLAALGFSGSDAARALAMVREFVRENGATLEASERRCDQAQADLDQVQSLVDAGTQDDELLSRAATASESLGHARLERDLLLGGLLTQVGFLLTPDQQAMWRAARMSAAFDRQGGPRPTGAFRYVESLNEQQCRELSSESLTDGQIPHPEAVREILSSRQWTQLQMARHNLRSNAEAAIAAEEEQLRKPVRGR